jgi:hypothetical protein
MSDIITPADGAIDFLRERVRQLEIDIAVHKAPHGRRDHGPGRLPGHDRHAQPQAPREESPGDRDGDAPGQRLSGGEHPTPNGVRHATG